jgi:plasmid stabilization system protein ParE
VNDCFPGQGARVREWDCDELREIVVENYRVIYLRHVKAIVILTVIHGASQLSQYKIEG